MNSEHPEDARNLSDTALLAGAGEELALDSRLLLSPRLVLAEGFHPRL